MNIDKLIAEIQDKSWGHALDARNIRTNDVIELIETMLDGKVIVPVEPTEAMNAAAHIASNYEFHGGAKIYDVIYKAMVTIGEQDA